MVNRLVFVDNTVSGAPIAICHCRVKAVIEKHNCVSIKVFCLFPVQGRRTASPHSKGEGGEGAQPITALLFLRTIKYFSHGPNLSMLMNFFAE